MKISQCFFVASLCCAAVAFSACGSSNSSPNPNPLPSTAPTAVPIPAASPFSASAVVTAPSGGAPLALPAAAGNPYTGSIGLGTALSLPAGTQIANTLTNVAPSGLPALSALAREPLDRRSTQAAGGALVVLAYIELNYTQTAVYNAAPSVTIKVPLADVVPASYYVAEYDPTRTTLGWQDGFEGPANVTGSTLAFTGAQKPFTFVQNETYYFAVYAISASAPAPTPAPSIAPVVPTPAPAASLAPFTVTLGSGATLTYSPPGSGVTATVTLPTANSSTTALVTPTNLPPAGVSPAPGNVAIYAAVTPKASITFTQGIVSGGFVASSVLTGSYYLSLLVPNAAGTPGLGWLSTSPSVATNNAVSFSFTLTQPITLNAGSTYVFAVTQ